MVGKGNGWAGISGPRMLGGNSWLGGVVARLLPLSEAAQPETNLRKVSERV